VSKTAKAFIAASQASSKVPASLRAKSIVTDEGGWGPLDYQAASAILALSRAIREACIGNTFAMAGGGYVNLRRDGNPLRNTPSQAFIHYTKGELADAQAVKRLLDLTPGTSLALKETLGNILADHESRLAEWRAKDPSELQAQGG
jgi:hypothetical protein